MAKLVRKSDWLNYLKYRFQIRNRGELNTLKQYLFARPAYVSNSPVEKYLELDY